MAEKADLLRAREKKNLSNRTWRQRPHYDATTTGEILLAVQGTSSRPFRKQGQLKWRKSLAWCHTESPLGESLGRQRTNTPCGPIHRYGRSASSSTSQGFASNTQLFGSFRLTSWKTMYAVSQSIVLHARYIPCISSETFPDSGLPPPNSAPPMRHLQRRHHLPSKDQYPSFLVQYCQDIGSPQPKAAYLPKYYGTAAAIPGRLKDQVMESETSCGVASRQQAWIASHPLLRFLSPYPTPSQMARSREKHAKDQACPETRVHKHHCNIIPFGLIICQTHPIQRSIQHQVFC